MKYTVELVNNKLRCKVITLNHKLYTLEGYELYQFLKDILDDKKAFKKENNNGHVFLTHKKTKETVIFKDYKRIEKPLEDFYKYYTKKELKEKKIREIKTKAAVGVITSTIVTSIIAGTTITNILNKATDNAKASSGTELFTPVDEANEISIKGKKITLPDLIETNIAPLISTQPEEYSVSESPNEVTQVELDVNAVYDPGINERNEPYLEEINTRATKWGISPELMYDIVSQEYGGGNTNLTHVIFDSWKNQVLYAYNFESMSVESFVITDTPEKYTKVNHVITKDDLKNPKTNVSAGAIILQYSLAQFDYNIPLGIQAYNNGITAVNNIIEETMRHTGYTREEILASNEPVWQDYTYIINADKSEGDPKADENYFRNIVKHIDEDQQESKLNDVYAVSYLNDEEKIETKEVQYKLR